MTLKSLFVLVAGFIWPILRIVSLHPLLRVVEESPKPRAHEFGLTVSNSLQYAASTFIWAVYFGATANPVFLLQACVLVSLCFKSILVIYGASPVEMRSSISTKVQWGFLLVACIVAAWAGLSGDPLIIGGLASSSSIAFAWSHVNDTRVAFQKRSVTHIPAKYVCISLCSYGLSFASAVEYADLPWMLAAGTNLAMHIGLITAHLFFGASYRTVIYDLWHSMVVASREILTDALDSDLGLVTAISDGLYPDHNSPRPAAEDGAGVEPDIVAPAPIATEVVKGSYNDYIEDKDGLTQRVDTESEIAKPDTLPEAQHPPDPNPDPNPVQNTGEPAPIVTEVLKGSFAEYIEEREETLTQRYDSGATHTVDPPPEQSTNLLEAAAPVYAT